MTWTEWKKLMPMAQSCIRRKRYSLVGCWSFSMTITISNDLAKLGPAIDLNYVTCATDLNVPRTQTRSQSDGGCMQSWCSADRRQKRIAHPRRFFQIDSLKNQDSKQCIFSFCRFFVDICISEHCSQSCHSVAFWTASLAGVSSTGESWPWNFSTFDKPWYNRYISLQSCVV